jgi:predicted Zn finger-like uncharacterized protein
LRGYIADLLATWNAMYTTCPECNQIFRIQADHLRAAAGKVRCGDCGAVFVALERVYETRADAQQRIGEQLSQEIDDLVGQALGQLPTDTPGDEIQPRSPQPLPVARPPEAVDFDFFANPPGGEFTVGKRPVQPVVEVAADGEDDFLAYAESERGTVAGISYRGWGAIAASLLLTVLLVGQYAYIERNRLAANHELRPLLEHFCGWLGCDLPLYRAPEALEMVEHDIRAHPQVDGVLLVSAAFINQAGFEQPWPVFRVSFSDVSGTTVALRDFQPQEYLQSGEVPGRGLLPGQRVQTRLEIIDPGDRAMSYQFDFF